MFGKLALEPVEHCGGRHVKYIIAVIKPFKLDEVREALSGVGVAGMTVIAGELQQEIIPFDQADRATVLDDRYDKGVGLRLEPRVHLVTEGFEAGRGGPFGNGLDRRHTAENSLLPSDNAPAGFAEGLSWG